MRTFGMSLFIALLAVVAFTTSADAQDKPPTVRQQRPRIWVRADNWDGPTFAKLKGWMDRPEYKARADKLSRTLIGQAILYKLSGDPAQGKALVARLAKAKIGGSSPSYSGIEAEKLAAIHDWMHDDPLYDEQAKKAVIAELEKWGDEFKKYTSGGGPTPFYSRISGALAGLTLIGLSLQGDSPKAEGYIASAADFLRTKFGTIRQAEDGATGGGCYGYHHEFTDCANLVAAWRSATDWDAADWITKDQGDWLRRQMLFHIWMTNANGWRFKDGDLWGGRTADKTQYLMHVSTIAGIYKDGFGRSYLDQSAKRWGTEDFHSEYAWEWFLLNDPTVKPRPLSELGKMAVFSPGLHGIVAMRSSWEPDATVIHFKCGETCDHHGSWDQGKFTIFRHQPLAIKNGMYADYKSSMHLYNKSPWSANCVVFTGPNYFGWQPLHDFDGYQSWSAWDAERKKRNERSGRGPTGVILASEATDGYARVLGDLSGSAPKDVSWTRELVFLGYKYLLVLDRVKAPKDFTSRWLLHSVNVPEVDGRLVRIDNGKGRLFCQVLLPDEAKIINRRGEQDAYLHLDSKGNEKRLLQADGKPWDKFVPAKAGDQVQLGYGRVDVEAGAGDAVYLTVLYPTETDTETMPRTAVSRQGADLGVTVGDLKHTFKIE